MNIKKMFTCITVFLLFFISLGLQSIADEKGGFSQEKMVLPSEVGQVVSVETFGDVKPMPDGELQQVKQSVEVKVLTGVHKGDVVFIDNMLMGNPAYDIDLKKGNKVILHAEQSDGGVNFFIADKQRVGALYFLVGLFVLLLLAVGHKKGLYSLISIFVTLALVFWGLTPLVLAGVPPVLATVLTCVLSALIAIYMVGGFNAKSTSAVLGTILSLIFAGFLSMLVIHLASLTGFSSEESMFLFSAHPSLNFVGVLASAMIIGALGAVMDVGMSIASTVNELYFSNSQMGIRDLFDSGMNVGRDIIGTMANTLILAYLGGALALVFLSENIDMQKFFNLNQVATEISSALIGSVAIVVCVPITAIISAFLIKKFENGLKKSDMTLDENDFSGIM